MRSLLLALALPLSTAAFAGPASAVPVDITYNITGGRNTTLEIGGGANPTGGTATVRWTLTSLYGDFSYGFGGTMPRGSLRSGSVTAPFTTALPNATDVTPSVSGGLARIIQNGGLTPPFASAYVTHFYSPTPGRFNASFTVFAALGGGKLVVTGNEVSRSLVPEPNPTTAALVALGVTALVARGRRSRSSLLER